KEAPLSKEDVRSIVEIECHPKVQEWVYEYVDADSQKELREYQEFFRKLPENMRAEILVAKYDGCTVGFLGLWRRGVYMEHVASIGISVHPEYWGRGIATALIKAAIELARRKGLRRLEAETLSANTAMRYTVEKLGFTLECLRKKRVLKAGSYHDEAAYFLLL
ncbi:MAG: GNAT family N-acetyltransferase, partial [Candidatus Bathyarchaeota archaeon]|nr:GNAT family N-acetyltransferase [Candidatus Bathyarchaeota archaeon]